MSKPYEFRLMLKPSAFKYQLRSLERYRSWFPPAYVEFEFRSYDRVYKTCVETANRIRLHSWLKDHPEASPGDYIVFTPLSEGREWLVRLEKGKAELGRTEEPKPHRKVRTFDHSELQEILVQMAGYYSMYGAKELRHEYYIFDVVWKRVETGNPTKVFEVQAEGNLDSALAKLKHARDTWNADLFLIVTGSKDAEKAEFLLGGSFHEIRGSCLVLRASEIYEISAFKEHYALMEKRLQK